MESAFQSALLAEYAGALRDQLNHMHRPLFWDGTYGPPDTRPYYGPDAPSWVADGACGYIDCPCCNAWREMWDDHCC